MQTPYLLHAWASSPLRWLSAGGVTLLFALAARILRGVTNSGAMAGALACILLFIGGGPGAFVVLAVLFAVTWVSTRLGYPRKRELGIAERHEGRNGWQVLANLGAAGIASLLYAIRGEQGWLVASAAALVEAAADTVASEVGQTYGAKAILITTGRAVPAGTDGGITWIGTISGIAVAMILMAVAVLGGMVPEAQFWIPAAVGVAGMFVDSLLGATLQRRGWINNEGVNLCSTLIGAAMAWVLAR